MATLEERLVEVESRIVMQERTIEQLDEVIREQGQALERLRAQIANLTEQLHKTGGEEHPDPPPPHY